MYISGTGKDIAEFFNRFEFIMLKAITSVYRTYISKNTDVLLRKPPKKVNSRMWVTEQDTDLQI